ncbi:hypothetical protein M409DRAFT_58968 [Zasmidium cellare ATCC 36951]|uniref:Uncharacterized protein n=1 Tax=Zasmidium cellare ATCC 36951 TaxID=1080233 RepID=A0A6A6C5U4_ZASCE|nr:uncharacterized protein M409DRAFT_58968 [Zasmidium cellare ATCC 36951]KAF2161570.1 hypothetical protein M409DRAFT_58968 [Zasmidium cellare ATCC 36951]
MPLGYGLSVFAPTALAIRFGSSSLWIGKVVQIGSSEIYRVNAIGLQPLHPLAHIRICSGAAINVRSTVLASIAERYFATAANTWIPTTSQCVFCIVTHAITRKLILTVQKRRAYHTSFTAVMVQYKSNNFKSDDYWKLARHVGKPRKFYHTGLNTLNYKFNVSTTRPRLAYLVSRAQRGFMSYEKRSLNELKAFCTARKIQGVDRFAGKRQLIALLEREDDAGASFNRFFDLPPELRNRIYSFYMDAIDDFETGRISRHRTQHEILTGLYKPPPPITQPVTIGEPAIPAPWCWELSETERTVVVDAVKQQLALFLDARQSTASTMTMLTKYIFEELIGICGRVTKEANTQLE